MPYTPGSGASNAGYAVVYDNHGDMQRMHMANLMQQQNQERQDRIERQRQADDAHRFALQRYYGKDFDPNNFDTGTDLNKNINDLLIQGKQSLSDVLNRPGASDQDIDNAAQQALIPAQKLYQVGTAIKRNIDTSLEGLQNDKTLAPYLGSLKKQAFVNALYTKDPKTGQLRLKNDQELSQVDPNQNFASDILLHNPQLVVNGNIDWSGMRKRFETTSQDLSGAHYTSPGVKSKSDFKAVWRPDLQDLVQDKTGTYKVITKSDPIITKDANGNEVEIPALPQTALNAMQSTPGELANMNVATMHYLAEHSPNVSVEPNTEAFENAKRIMAYQMVKDWGAKAISDKHDETRSGLRIRFDMGVPMPGSGSGAKSGEDLKQETQASFNDITDVPFDGDNGFQGTIKDGKFVPFEPKGGIVSKLFGTVPKYKGEEITGSIPLDKLPISVFNAVTAGNSKNNITGEKDNVGDPIGKVKVKIKDGQITAIKTDHGWFDVGDRTNANIKIQNSTTPMKNKQNYKLPDAKQNVKKDPLGLF